MRKGTVLFFILLLGVPTLTHAQPAKDVLMALKKLQARTQTGINYQDYGTALGEAKFPYNLFIESKDALNYPEYTASIIKVMGHYDFAYSIWDTKIKMVRLNNSGGLRIPGYGESVSFEIPKGQEILLLYPDANEHLVDSKALGEKKEIKKIFVDSFLPIIWKEASRELDNTTKLYAKMEDKSSDETATLKNEIAKLKAEVARLKKVNYLLKNPKKVKRGN